MKKTYDEQTKKLEIRLNELKSQLATAYAGIQAANNKSAEQTTVSQRCFKIEKVFKNTTLTLDFFDKCFATQLVRTRIFASRWTRHCAISTLRKYSFAT